MWLIFIFVVIIIVVGAVVGGMGLFGGNGDSDPDNKIFRNRRWFL